MRVVERIVHFQPEFRLEPLRNERVLVQVNIPTSHPGSSRIFRPELPKRGWPAASAASMN